MVDPTPIVFLGNKADLAEERKLFKKHILFPMKKSCKYWDISVKTGENLTCAIEHILRVLTRNSSLKIIQPIVKQQVIVAEDQDNNLTLC